MTPEQRELLERAAKAAGKDITLFPLNPDDWTWNPITDHGDRYRLMRKVGCWIQDDCVRRISPAFVINEAFTPGDDESEGWAVVRAAAATLGEKE